MTEAHLAIIVDLALLATFLISIAASRYVTQNAFSRTRFLMSVLFIYIVATLTTTYWRLALETIPFVVPAFLVGLLIGSVVGVRAERQKLFMHGMERYMERFAHIGKEDLQNFTWWSFINFYSISCVLILINLIGFTTVIMESSNAIGIAVSVLGAALVGSIVPYLFHLWTLQASTQTPDIHTTPRGE
jgi:hypothetical protein